MSTDRSVLSLSPSLSLSLSHTHAHTHRIRWLRLRPGLSLYDIADCLLNAQAIDIQTALILSYFDVNNERGVFRQESQSDEAKVADIQRSINMWKQNSFTVGLLVFFLFCTYSDHLRP